ncbi:MAG TPA: hypothetical protein VE198_04450 [Actinoallomurus sp.]|nr:hypothetical protein [Actinoallomurus sp.]
MISVFTTWQIGTVIALALSLVLLLDNRRRGNSLGEAFIETSAAVFCAIAMIISFAAPEAPLREFIAALSAGWQALTAWLSLMLRRPFTLGPQLRSIPRPHWPRHPLYRWNLRASVIWAAAFTVTAVVLGLVESAMTDSEGLQSVIEIAGYLVPAFIVLRYEVTQRRTGMAPAHGGDGTTTQPAI